jgi:hypothetical protein
VVDVYVLCVYGVNFRLFVFLQESDPVASVFRYQGAFHAMHSRVARLISIAAIDPASHDDCETHAVFSRLHTR